MNRICLSILILVLLSACGAKRVQLEPPAISITEIKFTSNRPPAATLNIDLRLDNTVPITLSAKAISLSIEIDNQLILEENQAYDIAIPKLGSEIIKLERTDAANLTTMFEEIQTLGSASYRIVADITLENGKKLNAEREGRLSPTPGKPGSFR